MSVLRLRVVSLWKRGSVPSYLELESIDGDAAPIIRRKCNSEQRYRKDGRNGGQRQSVSWARHVAIWSPVRTRRKWQRLEVGLSRVTTPPNGSHFTVDRLAKSSATQPGFNKSTDRLQCYSVNSSYAFVSTVRRGRSSTAHLCRLPLAAAVSSAARLAPGEWPQALSSSSSFSFSKFPLRVFFSTSTFVARTAVHT